MNGATPTRPVEILLVEDNPGDVRLTKQALAEAKLTNNLHVVLDGEQAMQFLRRDAHCAEVPAPDLILLDLNLPKKDGLEVLAEIKQDPTLQKIPVVVLTISSGKQDLYRAYDLGCDHYITKPVDGEDFITVVDVIENFWLTMVTAPAK